MGGCRCSYKDCPNTTKTTDNIHFFHYPVKHKERCKIWIENAEKPEFCNLEEDQLRNKVICELHFEDKWFPNSQKKRLLQGAVPTLDGPCERTVAKETDEDVHNPYKPSSFQDIKVLPANEDGTVFILDTESLFGHSQKIESYTYKNGHILPSQPAKPVVSPQQKQHSVVKVQQHPQLLNPSTSIFKREVEYPSVYEPAQKYIGLIDDEQEYKVQVKKEQCDYGEQHSKEGEHYEVEQEQTVNMKHVDTKSSPAKAIDKKYVRTIKQHSRDIATIKRLLKQQQGMKVDLTTAVNALRDHLPPSLFTIICLSLNCKTDLSDEDVDFFTNVHRTSPEVYQLLMDRYRWCLPSVDVVETLD